jgi:hypothetical protein
MTTYQQLSQALPQDVPAPPPPPAAPPPQGGAAPEAGLVPYEAQFLGNLLGTVFDKAAPYALRYLRDRITSMGTAAASDVQVAQEVDRFQAQFLGAFAPFIPIAIDVIGRFVQQAASGQAAGGAGAQVAGTAGAGAQVAGAAATGAYVR